MEASHAGSRTCILQDSLASLVASPDESSAKDAASNFASSFSFPQGGELGKLQIDIGKFMARKPIWTRVTDYGLQTRAHLETQLASSLALKSAQEYRQCLLPYVRFFARQLNVLSFGDEVEEENEAAASVQAKIKSIRDVLDDPRFLKGEPEDVQLMSI